MLKFESPAEMQAYPIINSLSIKHKLYFEYQKRFYETKQYTCKKHNGEWGKDIGFQEDCYYCKEYKYEKYRADFVLIGNNKKLIIEIDGEEYHQDKNKEYERDQYFFGLDFYILHIPANKLNTSLLKTEIILILGLKEE